MRTHSGIPLMAVWKSRHLGCVVVAKTRKEAITLLDPHIKHYSVKYKLDYNKHLSLVEEDLTRIKSVYADGNPRVIEI